MIIPTCLVLFLIIMAYEIYPIRIYVTSGISMYPTIKDGELLIGKAIKCKDEIVENNIYVFKNPNGNVNVKRLYKARFNNEKKCRVLYFLGDNREHSVDSREYGEVPEKNVIMKVDHIIRW